MAKAEDKSGSRLKFISYMQVLGIILVVLGHSMHEYPDGALGSTTNFHMMIYSFHMPVFIFVSGYLMMLGIVRREQGVWEFTRKKLMRLVLPYVVLTLVTFIPRSLMSSFADDSVEMSWGALINALLYGKSLIIPYLWFLQVCFMLLVSTFILLKLGAKARIRPLTLSCILLLIYLAVLPSPGEEYTDFLSLDRLAGYGIYFFIGIIYNLLQDKIDRIVRWESPLVFLSLVSIWAVTFFLTNYTIYAAICSVAGIAMCMSFAKIMEARDMTFLDHLVGANYMIFLLSWFCNVACQNVLHHFVKMPWWGYGLLSLITGIYLPMLAYRYLMSHPQSRWVRMTALLLGQGKLKG